MQTQTPSVPTLNSIPDEYILVVKRDVLLTNTSWQGLNTTTTEDLVALINTHKEFLPRSLMEVDPQYKQIIPYLVFTHNNRYFLMQRRAETTEQRLKNKYSIGIGGHINQEDMNTDSIIDWAKREFSEEVNYSGNYTVQVIGALNDDSNAVGEVHLGLVLLLHGDSDTIQVKSELKSGELLTLEECGAYYDSMESWTQIIVNYLKK